MAQIGSVAAATTDTIRSTYLPEWITFTIDADPTELQVNVLGDGVIMNLDASGVVVMNAFRMFERQSSRYTYQLANGIITGKNVDFTIANASVGTALDLYGFSPDGRGDSYAIYQKQTLLANSGTDLADFAVLGIDGPGASDIFIVNYPDGSQDKLSIEEIDAYQQTFQNYDPSATGLVIDNTLQKYSKVNVSPSADRTAYLVQYQPVANIENAPILRS